MPVAPFSTNPFYTNVSIAYHNTKYIADDVLFRLPVPQEEFTWIEHTQAESYTVPSTLIGRKGRANEVSFTGTEKPGFTLDYALADVVPQKDIDNAKSIPNYDPLGKSTEMLSDLISLDREMRVAALVTNPANYTFSTTLSGASQWSDPTSNPVLAIMSALDNCLMRPNIGGMSRPAWTQFRQNPKVLTAVKSTGGDVSAGMVSIQQVTDLFELDALHIGEAFVNSAKPGQTASFNRVWGKHAWFIHQNRMASPMGGGGIMTWGFTAQYGTRIAYTAFDPDIGLRGAHKLKVGESVAEVVSAKDIGYLFLNAVA